MALLDAGPDFSPLRLQQILGILQNLSGTNPPPQPASVPVPSPAPILTAPPVTQAASVAPDNSSPEMSAILSQLMNYEPERQASDIFMKHIQTMPQRQEYPPSRLRQVGSVLAGLGSGSPKEAMEVSEAYRNVPFGRALSDWERANKPLEAAATNEKNINLGTRQLLLGETARIAQAENYASQDRARVAKAETDRMNALTRRMLAEHPNSVFKYDDTGNMLAINPRTNEPEYLYNDDGTNIKSGDFAKTGLQIAGHIRTAQIGAAARIKAAEISAGKTDSAGWATVLVDGVPYGINPRLNQIRPMPQPGVVPESEPQPITPETAPGIPKTTPGQALSAPTIAPSAPVTAPAPPAITPTTVGAPGTGQPPAITRIGAPAKNDITTSTKTMMEGAQMLLPHVPELKAQAADLNKRGLFGVIQSRIRDLAAKIGTTGDASEVQSNLDKFANDLQNDPVISKTGDYMVGRFVLNLGLMASGAGRVHGQARGGGSIQMIQYMKALLSADSTIDMFFGRADELENYLKGYAAGPKAREKNKSELDRIIEEALKKKRQE